MNNVWLKNFAKQASDAFEQAKVAIEENVARNQPHIERVVKQIGDNVTTAAKNIHKNLAGDPFTRDRLNSSEIESLDLVYISPRIIGSKFPVNTFIGARNPVSDGNRIDLMAAFLHQNHEGKFMIWNISEESYDYSYFSHQVIEYRFPGNPVPPLGMIFAICRSIESWLAEDPENVAVVHCLTGRGRTTTILSCLLAWLGEAALSPIDALECVAAAKNLRVEDIIIPSQKRYVEYFSNILDGVKPKREPLILKRVVLNTIPNFGTRNETSGCCPYIQIFNRGKLLKNATYNPSTSPRHNGEEQDESSKVKTENCAKSRIPQTWVYCSDESIAIEVNCVLRGDYMIRGRHFVPGTNSVTMFRTSFHTGYIPCGVLRLGIRDIDGTRNDERFDQDFFIDLIFAPVETSAETNLSKDAHSCRDDIVDFEDPKFWEDIEIRKVLREQNLARNTLMSQDIKKETKRVVQDARRDEEQFSIGACDDESSRGSKRNVTKHVEAELSMKSNEGISNADLLAKLSLIEDEKELTALEELEKELGISAMENTISQNAKTFNADDDIDDFESYLDSVS